MGGCGSGNWHRSDRKYTVEESLTLAMRDFRDPNRSSGSITWTTDDEETSTIGYLVNWCGPPTIKLEYRWDDSEDVRVFIRLETTDTQFGGQRWWFMCPLTVNGVACKRRVGKLHLPPDARYFSCLPLVRSITYTLAYRM